MKTIKYFNSFINEDLDNSYINNEIRIKITNCDDESQWYKNSVGKEFIVVEDDVRNKIKNDFERWKVVKTEFAKGGNYIKKEDCEII